MPGRAFWQPLEGFAGPGAADLDQFGARWNSWKAQTLPGISR